MKQRVLLAGVALWLGVVVVASGLTWVVIQRVGHVVTSEAHVADTGLGAGPAGATTPSTQASPPPWATAPRLSASAAPRPHRTARPGTPPATPVAGGSGAGSTASPTPPPATVRPTPRAPSGPAPATAPRTPAPTPRPASVTRTWSGGEGRVSVSCTGTRAALAAASPSDGWRVEVGSRGPEEVEVTFKRGGDDGGEAQVQARCSGGGPQFRVERDGGGD